MTKIAIRGFIQRAEKPKKRRSFNIFKTPLRHSRVLIFDTETTIDQYQNFKIGFFQIYHDGCLYHEGLFYDTETLNEKEIKTLVAYSRKYGIDLYLLNEFIDKVFYPEVFGLKTLCIGYNLAFDISRIAKRSGDSREKNRGGFTLTLSDDIFKPPIVVKKIGDAYNFKFTTTKQNKGENYFSGYFLDLKNWLKSFFNQPIFLLKRQERSLTLPFRK